MSAVAQYLLRLVDPTAAARATGIRVSRLISYAEGRVSPTETTARILNNAYRRVTYAQARESGFGSYAASKLRGTSPDILNAAISDIQKSIGNISELYGIPPDDVLKSMQESNKEPEDLTRYGDNWRDAVMEEDELPF